MFIREDERRRSLSYNGAVYANKRTYRELRETKIE